MPREVAGQYVKADFARLATAVGLCILQLSCGDGPMDGSSGISSVTVSPTSALVVVNDTARFVAAVAGSNANHAVSWRALSGVVDASGLYRAPNHPAADTVTAVSVADADRRGSAAVTVWTGIESVAVTPASGTVVIGDTSRFAATVSGPNPDHRVRWRADRGSVDSTGLYDAPAGAGPDTVRVVAVVDSAKTGLSLVNVITGIDVVTVAPPSVTVLVGDTARFTANVTGPNSDHGVNWRAAHGTIDSSGLYTAPGTARGDTVRAVSRMDSSKAAVAPVKVLTGIESVTVQPTSAMLLERDTVRFAATVTGANPNHRVSWKALHGSVDSTGLYTARTGAGYDTVLVASAVDPARRAAAAVTVQALVEVSGQLQGLDHVGVVGTLVLYEVVGADTFRLRAMNSDFFGYNATDGQGNFTIRVARGPSQVSSLLLMARQGTPGSYQGYVRTIQIPAGNSSGVLIKAVPYPAGVAPADFVTFMIQVTQADSTLWPPRVRFDLLGEYVPNFGGLRRIRILDHGYFADSTLTLPPSGQEMIRSKVLDPADIGGLIGGYAIDSASVVFGNDTADYYVSEVDPSDPLYPFVGAWKVTPKEGVIVVVPKNLPGAVVGYAMPLRTGPSLATRGTIYLQGAGAPGLVSHEFGHMFLGVGHNTILDPSQTVMWSGNILQTTGPMDKFAGRLLYEQTFMTVLPWFGFWSLDMLGNILRLDFK